MTAPAVPATLAELEEVVDRGRRALPDVIAAGRALAEIRDRHLFDGFASFEDYLQARWGLSRATAYRWIDSATISGLLGDVSNGDTPANEAQFRELAPLRDQPEVLAETWRDVVESPGPVTAAKVREAVQSTLNEVPPHDATRATVRPGLTDEAPPAGKSVRQPAFTPDAPTFVPVPGCGACQTIALTAEAHLHDKHGRRRAKVIDITPAPSKGAEAVAPPAFYRKRQEGPLLKPGGVLAGRAAGRRAPAPEPVRSEDD